MAISVTYTPPKRNALVVLAAAAELAVDAVANEVLDEAQPNVPVLDGVMKASGRVVPGDVMGGLVTAHVTYGSDDDGTATHAPSNQYVVEQHEDGDLDHPNGGNWKWLEHAMHQAAADARETIAKTIREAFEL